MSDEITVLYRHTGNQVEYQITQMPESYEDSKCLMFWKRIKTGEEWGKWVPVTAVQWDDPEDEDEAHCDDSECEECGGNIRAKDNTFHDILCILIEDANIFKAVYTKGKAKLKEQIDKIVAEQKNTDAGH